MEVGDFFELEHFDPRICKVGEGGLCNVCSNITALDTQIQHTFHLLYALLLERQSVLKTKINLTHDPLIRHLPLEVISHIFTFYVHDSKPLLVDGHVRHSRNTDRSAPLIISAVCRRWREIAFSTPSLWTSPNIYLSSEEQILLQENLMAQWLGRSGRLPLDISISVRCSHDDDDDDDGLPTLPTYLPVFTAIKTYAARWRKLCLSLSPNIYYEFFADLQHAPSLEDLRLLCYYPRHQVHSILDLRFPEIPTLKNFTVNFSLLSIQLPTIWTNLISLQMTCVDIGEVFEILRDASNLEQSVFTIKRLNGRHYPLPSHPITQHCLRDLEIQPASELIATPLLDNLILPSLTRFSYNLSSEYHHYPFPRDALLSLLHRSRVPVLRQLEIKGTHLSITDDDLIKILESIPFIIRLSLRCAWFAIDRGQISWLTDGFFQKFRRVHPATGQHLSANPIILPTSLKRLDLDVSGLLPFSWDSFLVFLESIHASFLDAQPRDESAEPSGSPSTSHHIDIDIRLDPFRSPDSRLPYIKPDIVSRLVNPDWSKFISLKILHKRKKTDLIQEALRYRQDASQDSA